MSPEIKNISFVEYIALPDRSEYDYILRYSNLVQKPLDLYELGPMEDDTFGFVKDAQDLLNHTGLTWERFFDLMKDRTGFTPEEMAGESLFDLQRCRVFLRSQVEIINKIESSLSYEPTGEEEAAGLERFSKYRSFLQFDKLANGKVWKIKDIRKLDYSICFAKLMLMKDSSDYENDLNKLRMNKHK